MDYYLLISYYLLFPLALILVSLPLILRRRNSVPPGTTGWPVLGETLTMSRNPKKFIFDKMKKTSSKVFKTSLLGEKTAVLCGQEGNKFIFSNANGSLKKWLPKSLCKLLTGTTNIEFNFGFLHQIMKPESLKKYAPLMDSVAREQLRLHWTHGQVVKVFPLARRFTFGLAWRILMGINNPALEKRVEDSFAKLNSGLFSIPIDLPGTAYRRALRESANLRRMLLDIVTEKAKNIDNHESDDFMCRIITWLRNNNINNGSDKMTREEEEFVVSNMIGLLLASYDTTSSVLTFSLNFIAELPHIFQKVYEEQMDIVSSKSEGEYSLNWEDIQKMKYTWNVVRESMRIVPPTQGNFNDVITDMDYAGFTIPKGWKTFWSTFSTHNNPEYFPEPEKFDPSRFEGQGPAPFTFVPFGGGAHMCSGREYARLEIMVFIHRVVTQFKLEKVVKDEKIVYIGSPIPANGLPLRLHRH